MLVLAGCTKESIKQPDVVTHSVTAIEKLECGAEPTTSKIRFRTVDPYVVIDQAGIVWIGITPKHYENLALNWQDALVHLKERKAQVEWWRDCVADQNRRADEFAGGGDAEARGGGEHDTAPASSGTDEGQQSETLEQEG